MPYREPAKPNKDKKPKTQLLYKKPWWITKFQLPKVKAKLVTGDKLVFHWVRGWYCGDDGAGAEPPKVIDGSFRSKTSWRKLWYTTEGNWVFYTRVYLPQLLKENRENRFQEWYFWDKTLDKVEAELRAELKQAQKFDIFEAERSVNAFQVLKTIALAELEYTSKAPKKVEQKKPKIIKV